MMKWDAYHRDTLQEWTPDIPTLQSSFSLICSGTGYLSNPRYKIFNLAWSHSDQAVIQIVLSEFQSSQTYVDRRGNWRALQTSLALHSCTGAFCPPWKTHLKAPIATYAIVFDSHLPSLHPHHPWGRRGQDRNSFNRRATGMLKA